MFILSIIKTSVDITILRTDLQSSGTGGRGQEEAEIWARVAGQARQTSRRSEAAKLHR